MELATADRKRKTVTNAQRQALRKRKREHRGHHSELIARFKSQYDHTLNQSQVSKIISSSYDQLDSLIQRRTNVS
ncbi:hypothetical protein GcM3_046026 [Golovinomyces cichoracearum]|uniref:ARS-binding protein 1 N-terminal domain-containing protein n=1 Tax=Golovinomyces cichoracearum TaxID=62708 RepID=A0A420J0N9_9PEZI|nr:hypothetical protein GcM3_046026 [Golovinomyces cichoracearum]